MARLKQEQYKGRVISFENEDEKGKLDYIIAFTEDKGDYVEVYGKTKEEAFTNAKNFIDTMLNVDNGLLKRIGKELENMILRDVPIAKKTFKETGKPDTVQKLIFSRSDREDNFKTIDNFKSGKFANGFIYVYFVKDVFVPSGYLDGNSSFKKQIEIEFPFEYKNIDEFKKWANNFVSKEKYK